MKTRDRANDVYFDTSKFCIQVIIFLMLGLCPVLFFCIFCQVGISHHYSSSFRIMISPYLCCILLQSNNNTGCSDFACVGEEREII